MTDLQGRLKHLIEQENLNTLELARRTGIGQPVIYRIMTGTTTNPRLETLMQLATYFNLSVSELIGESSVKNHARKKKDSIQSATSQIPLYKLSQYAPTKKTQKPNDFLIYQPRSKKCFAVLVDSSEYQPYFKEKSILIIDPGLTPESGDYVLLTLPKIPRPIVRKISFDLGDTYLSPLDSRLAPKKIV